MLLGEVFTLNALFTHPINLVVKKISRNKPVVQTPVTYFINQKEKHVSIQHKSILNLMRFGTPFFRTDVIYMVYLDVKCSSVGCLSIYCGKLTM